MFRAVTLAAFMAVLTFASLDVFSEHRTSSKTFLEVYVRDMEGNPVEHAIVQLVKRLSVNELKCYASAGVTDATGHTTVKANPGIYTLVVYHPHLPNRFVIKKEWVSVPGTISIDPSGSVPIDVEVRKTDGTPLEHATLSLQLLCYAYEAGWTNESGRISFFVTP